VGLRLVGANTRNRLFDRVDTFSQWIDTSAANFPIVFDPTYSVLDCNFNGRYSNLNAAQYLDMYSSSTNYGYCAPEPLHVRRNLYEVVWAFENNVANDYGWVLTRQAGECGVIPDTAGWYDFQVPCKAHDYCYDLRKAGLRKAGLSGTVTDANCDATFYKLMLADCNDRNVVARGLCNGTALSGSSRWGVGRCEFRALR